MLIRSVIHGLKAPLGWIASLLKVLITLFGKRLLHASYFTVRLG